MILWREDRLPTLIFFGLPGGSDSKESTHNARDLGLIPGLGRSPGGGHVNPRQYSCLENPHRQGSLEGYSPWGCKELDMTERLSTAQHIALWVCLEGFNLCAVLRRPPGACQVLMCTHGLTKADSTWVKPSCILAFFPPFRKAEQLLELHVLG